MACAFFILNGNMSVGIAEAISGALSRSLILIDVPILAPTVSKVFKACMKQDIFLIMIGKDGDIADAVKEYRKAGHRCVIVSPYKKIKGKDIVSYEIQNKVNERDLIVEKVFRWLKKEKIAKPLI